MGFFKLKVSEDFLMTTKPTYEELEQRVAALQERTDFLDKIIESAALSTWISDEKGTAIRTNPACLAFFGAAEEEVIGKYNLFQDVVIEKQGFMPDIKRVFEKGEVASILIDYDFGAVDHVAVKSATHKIINSIFTPVLDNKGKVSNVIVQTIDLTDIKNAEAALRESEERLRIAGKASYDLIYEWSVANDSLKWFGDIDALLGYDSGSISRDIDAWLELIHPEDRGQLENAVELHRTATEPIHYDYRIKHRDGTYRQIHDQGLPMLDEQGRPYKWIGVCSDITERKRTEEALKERESLFSQMFEQSTTSMCLYNPDGTINRVNNEFCKMFGVEEKVIIDAGYNVFKDQAAIDGGIIPFLRDIFEERKRQHWETNFDIDVASASTGTPTSRTGKIFIEVFGYPILNQEGDLEYVVLQHYDITERKQSEAALRESEKTVRKKLQAILEPEGDFGDLNLADIIDDQALQSMMEKFYGLTKIGGAIVDVSGKVLASVGWQDICAKFHRAHPETLKNCIESDTVLSSGVLAGNFKPYHCKNNMWDMVTPIEVGGRHMGNIFIGQFFYEGESPDHEQFRIQARRYGFDEVEYLAALERVPFWSRETIDTAMAFYAEIAGLISSLSYSTVKLSRALSQKDVMLRRLVASEERFRVIATYTPDHILIQDKDLRYVWVLNPQLGLTEKDMIGKTDFDFLSKEDAAVLTVMKKGVLETGKPEFVRVPLTSFKGDVQHFEGYYIPKRDQEGKIDGLIGYFRNVTERVEGEEQRKKLEAQLLQSQKMESVGTLAGGIAHDFNNILGIILGNTELALDDVPEWNPSRQNLDEIRKACLRAKDVVRQILSFSRKSEIEQKPFNIASVVNESLKLLRASIPASIDIRQDISNDSDNILGDPTQIHQIMINLCTNAAHAMEAEGGMLQVALKNTEVDEDAASLYPELSAGHYLQLCVSDTGDGIGPEVINRVFDPYFTTKDVGKGTGMGLAVVHGIVKSHRGSISVESEPGKGTTFKILFPAVKKKIGDEPKNAQELPTGNERILFVDDEESMVNLNQQRLERLGYKVIPKTDPLEALEFFSANPDQIDLVITDMTMPHMTGDRLTQEILKIRSDMPIILCTGYSSRISEDKAQELGIRKYIDKPIEMLILARSVREVLDGK